MQVSLKTTLTVTVVASLCTAVAVYVLLNRAPVERVDWTEPASLRERSHQRVHEHAHAHAHDHGGAREEDLGDDDEFEDKTRPKGSGRRWTPLRPR